ncbi:MAG: hypothetical protein H7252_02115 [Cytophaga sp.]|nr:hypothetical protein [Undibacterium sp.]
MRSAQLPLMSNQVLAWDKLADKARQQCWRDAVKLVGAMQTLGLRGEQVVQRIIGDNDFIEWEHYPDADVRDNKHASQYFYHAHPGLQRPFEEHGHFHLFVHANELGMRRADPRFAPAPAHLLAISMNAQGMPSGFFMVNRWVTKGPWLDIAHCESGLQHFQIKGRQGNKAINIFLRSLIRLYHAPIMALLEQRDSIMQKLCAERDRRSVFADKKIEVLCYQPIQLMDDIAALEELIQDR